MRKKERKKDRKKERSKGQKIRIRVSPRMHE